MATDFTYSHEFADIAPMQAYKSIMNWLDKEGGIVKEKSAPASIKAIHGSLKTVSVWKRSAKKKLYFSIKGKGTGTEIVLMATPGSLMYADDVGTMKDEINVNWGLLAEEIWRHVEGKSNSNVDSDFQRAKKNLADTNLVRGKTMIRNGAVTLLLGIAILAIFIIFVENPTRFLGGLVVLPVIGFGWMLFGFFKMRFGSE